MRWCVNNCVCRLVYRHLPALLLVAIFIASINQFFIHFVSESGRRGPICYKIVSSLSLLSRTSESNVSRHNASTEIDVLLPNVKWSQGRFDERRKLRIYDWAWTASSWDSTVARSNVCLATQGSIDRIHSIGEVSEKWNGPISLAVYLHSKDELWILSVFVSFMRRCIPSFAQTVSIHVAVPFPDFEGVDYLNQSLYHEIVGEEYPCGQYEQFMAMLISKMLFHPLVELYPQNHMRNIARKNCQNPWVLMTDVDIIPSPNSSQKLSDFYSRVIASKCHKCAFVIPVFELDKSIPYPKIKKELVNVAKKGWARQFHLKVYKYGHWATNYSAWMTTNLYEEEPIKVSHPVDGKANHYEPFYVSPDEIPPHDERFVGYGFTRSSQVLEARMMGWRFFVLTPIFAIHWGLQTPQTIRSPSIPLPILGAKSKWKPSSLKTSRRAQNVRNHVVYTDFVSELMARYNISAARRNSRNNARNQQQQQPHP